MPPVPPAGPPVSPANPYSPYPPQQPPPQHYNVQIQQPKVDGSKRFLNLSMGALIAVITGIILVCCVGPVALCMFGGVLDGFNQATKTQAQVTITSCSIDDKDEFLKTAKIAYTVKNPGKGSQDYTIKFQILDAAGSQVGKTTAYAWDLDSESTVSDTETVYLDAAGGTKCRVSEVS